MGWGQVVYPSVQMVLGALGSNGGISVRLFEDTPLTGASPIVPPPTIIVRFKSGRRRSIPHEGRSINEDCGMPADFHQVFPDREFGPRPKYPFPIWVRDALCFHRSGRRMAL